MRGFPYIAEPYVERWSNRPPHLNHEGGALNADYTTVDALCAIANHLGKHGLEYNRDWYWEGRGWYTNCKVEFCQTRVYTVITTSGERT